MTRLQEELKALQQENRTLREQMQKSRRSAAAAEAAATLEAETRVQHAIAAEGERSKRELSLLRAAAQAL